MYKPIHLLQGIRYFKESIKQKINGPTKYNGNATQICKQIINNCWNGKYYQTSTHHYQEYWARDTGYCAESLMKLGHADKLRKTLAYALEKYSKTGIKTTISREGIPFSFPEVYSPDSTALTLHALRIAKAEELVKEHRNFLQTETDAFATIVLQDGIVRKNVHFSEMRDHARHNSSCYTHCMAILMAREAKKLGFQFQYTEKELIKKLNDYWIKEYYYDDRTNPEPSGDANTLPYWLGIGKQYNKTLKTLKLNDLDKPIPLAYSKTPHKHMIKAEILVPGWQHDTKWALLGLIWANATKKYNKKQAQQYKEQYTKIIEHYGTLYEVYNTKAQPYQSPFYHADEGMLWAAMYLNL